MPIEISKNESDRVVYLLFYKNHYVLIRKLQIYLGSHNCNYNGRKCLGSFTSENVILKHKQRCEQQ